MVSSKQWIFKRLSLYDLLLNVFPQFSRDYCFDPTIIFDTLSLSPHVKYLSAKSAQNAFALRTLHAHGLSGRALWTVTQAHIISRLTYACSAWWGFCNSGERDQLAAVVTRLAKKNYLLPDQPTLHEMVTTADVQLFNQVVANPTHVLSPLIPLSKSHSYNLRKRPHDLQILHTRLTF